VKWCRSDSLSLQRHFLGFEILTILLSHSHRWHTVRLTISDFDVIDASYTFPHLRHLFVELGDRHFDMSITPGFTFAAFTKCNTLEGLRFEPGYRNDVTPKTPTFAEFPLSQLQLYSGKCFGQWAELTLPKLVNVVNLTVTGRTNPTSAITLPHLRKMRMR